MQRNGQLLKSCDFVEFKQPLKLHIILFNKQTDCWTLFIGCTMETTDKCT